MNSEIDFNLIIAPNKAFTNCDFTIALPSSDYYVPYLACAIESMVEYSQKQHNYDIIILERNILDINKKRLVDLIVGRENFSIRFVNLTKITANLRFYVPGKRLSAETYFGLLMPWILRNHERALYMNCDMVLCTDIANAYDFDWTMYYAGVVKDIIWQGFCTDTTTGMEEYARNTLKVKNPYDNFNGGFINLNLEKIRREIDPSKVIRLITQYEFHIVDQDIFNILLEGKVYYLPEEWCHLVSSTQEIEKYIALSKDRDLYRKANENPYLLHFAGAEKPWNNPDIAFGDRFWKVARNTPFYEILLSRMIAHHIEHMKPILTHNEIDNQESRSLVRKIADFIMPKGSRLRRVAKRIMPAKGTPIWNKLRHIYHLIMGPNRP